MVVTIGVIVTFMSKPIYRSQAKLVVPQGSATLNMVDSRDPLSDMMRSFAQDSLPTQSLIAICISAATAAALAPLPFAQTRVANAPNQAALLACLD